MMNYNHPYGTFCAEPSCEDAWEDPSLNLTEQYNEECFSENTHNDSADCDYSYADGYER